MIPDFTVVVAVDFAHLEQLRVVLPTWRAYRPELFERLQSWLVICDDPTGRGEVAGTAHDILSEHGARKLYFARWSWEPSLTQRERMLTAFVSCCHQVETPYWLKLDTDAFATQPGPWIDERWFDDSPAIIASPWGYTTPSHWPATLDAWGDTVPELAKYPPLNIPYDPAARTVSHPRIASWVMFGRTDFAHWCSSLVPEGERLPVPSQDTMHWYLAQRTGELIRPVKMKRFGWSNASKIKNLRQAVAGVMANA